MIRSTAKKWVFFILALSFCANIAKGQRPPKDGGGTGGTGTGTIFYQSDTMKAMRPDGAGKVQVLPEVSFGHLLFPSDADPTKPYALRGIPCDQVHGSDPFHDRWYLTWVQTNTYDEVYRSTGAPVLSYPHWDVFAYRTDPLDRSQVVTVQVTDLYGIFAPEFAGMPEWSNDTNESTATSFISISGGYDIRNSFLETTLSDGSSYSTFVYDESLTPFRSVRLPWTASYVQAQWLSGASEPFRPTTLAQLDELFYGWAGNSRLTSPDGTAYAFVSPDRILSIFDSYDRSTLKVLWDGTGSAEPRYPANPVWSRDGLSVAFINEGNSVYSSSGGVWSVPVASGAPRQLAKNVSKGFKLTRFGNAMWSDDAKFIVMNSSQEGSTGFSTAMDLLRIPAGGGVAVNLTADTDEFVSGMRWVSNVPAPLAP